MTDNERRVAGFWALFGAVSLPFGGVLGGLLGDVGKRLIGPDGSVTVWQATKLGAALVGLMMFFAFVPLLGVAIVKRWERKGRELMWLGGVALAYCLMLMPSTEFGIPSRLWVATTSAWLLCCFAISLVCRFADMKKSIF